MPLFYQQNINQATRLAVWKIEEPETFFSGTVPLQREITHPNKRLQHLAGRYLLRYLFPAFPYQEILIADTRKPYLSSEAYHFSISHCGDYAAAIVSRECRVGIDIEIPSDKVARIAKKFLHAEEQDCFALSPQHTQPDVQLATVLWSAKEAMFKWWGWGEVDFSEMLRINPFTLDKKGTIQAQFLKNELVQDLQLHYHLLDNLSMVYVAS
jgi:phosphopantetheinyl transferase